MDVFIDESGCSWAVVVSECSVAAYALRGKKVDYISGLKTAQDLHFLVSFIHN